MVEESSFSLALALLPFDDDDNDAVVALRSLLAIDTAIDDDAFSSAEATSVSECIPVDLVAAASLVGLGIAFSDEDGDIVRFPVLLLPR